MEHNSYIARRRARFSGIGGIPVNIPYGTALEVREGFILFKGRAVDAGGRDYLLSGTAG